MLISKKYRISLKNEYLISILLLCSHDANENLRQKVKGNDRDAKDQRRVRAGETSRDLILNDKI